MLHVPTLLSLPLTLTWTVLSLPSFTEGLLSTWLRSLSCPCSFPLCGLGHVTSFIPVTSSSPGMWGKDHNLNKSKQKLGFQWRLCHLLSVNHVTSQPWFLRLWIRDSYTVWDRYISEMLSKSSDIMLMNRLWTLWFSILTNCIACADVFPSWEVDTHPLKCSNSDWLRRQEEQVHMPMSGMTHMTHLLENIECGVVFFFFFFTNRHWERDPVIIFTVTFPDLYPAFWVMSICWGHSLFMRKGGRFRRIKPGWVEDTGCALSSFL